ncbi:P-loop containing nucleoside triphosphate hydrolases superfamily protein isoform 1 [Hibiscus syriacus]|uniref:P-loop containing nucleoside triphosphate hydrolases superfamily protein isoform 1 n=2 Tax=Hibiscus syriacus TaxID=106335 RepID=A0A6A3CRZ6_HIBSY|nr:P-loop containing nucleoside triphosphate hydrolases superfamily protein isoform 1 [Hibiscus syriacus]
MVVMALRTTGGDEAVFQSLYRAREVYLTRIRENTTVDRLASWFSECAIAEAQPSKAEYLPCNPNGPSVASDAHGTSILAEAGRMQIVLYAFSDGRSFICLQCGGLVSNHRKDEHYAYWCANM